MTDTLDDGCLPAIRNASIASLMHDSRADYLVGFFGIILCTLWRAIYSRYLIKSKAIEYVSRVNPVIEKPEWMKQSSKDGKKKWEQVIELSERCRYQAHKSGSSRVRYDESVLTKLTKKFDLDPIEVRRTLKYLEYEDKCLDLESKYGEQLWKILTQGAMMVYGTYFMLLKAPFFWDTRLYWAEYPQRRTFEIKVLYFSQLAYHGHRALYQPYEHVKPDWLAYVIHHWVTLLLISLSWVTGFTQIGSVVMVLHDYSDVFLAIAKFAKYNEYEFCSDMSFIVFALTWVVCRMFLLCYKVIYSIMVETLPRFGCRETYRYSFLILLWSLFALHCYWAYLISLVAIKRWTTDDGIADVRSASEKEDDEANGDNEE